jgi:hypothetical protein
VRSFNYVVHVPMNRIDLFGKIIFTKHCSPLSTVLVNYGIFNIGR